MTASGTKTGFCGVAALIEKHDWQVSHFEELEKEGDLQSLHNYHFDWWAFPVDERSSFGTLWTLTPEAIRELRSKDEWISSFRRGVIIASRAWGWDVITGTVIKETGLMWTEWPVRLFKMGLSCMIFKQCDLEEGLAKFAHYLSSRKHSLVFHSSHTGGCLEVIKAWDVRRPTILP